MDWRDFRAWDVARREPLGPGLGDLDLAHPSVGLLHRRPALAAPAPPGSGTGLLGLQERVTLANGVLVHGPDASGDFVVEADLPW